MGFLPEETIYHLVFEDDLEGLEVRAKSVPMGPLMDILVIAERVKDIGPGNPPTGQDTKDVERLFVGFLDALVEWNLERRNKDGEIEPVPMDLEGVRSQDLHLMVRIVREWIHAVSGVAAPLDDSSPSGDPSLEESLPMEPLSPSPSSLPTPV